MTHKQFKDYLIARLTQDIQRYKNAYSTAVMNEVFIENIHFIENSFLFKSIFKDFEKNGSYSILNKKFEDYYQKILNTVKRTMDKRI